MFASISVLVRPRRWRLHVPHPDHPRAQSHSAVAGNPSSPRSRDVSQDPLVEIKDNQPCGGEQDISQVPIYPTWSKPRVPWYQAPRHDKPLSLVPDTVQFNGATRNISRFRTHINMQSTMKMLRGTWTTMIRVMDGTRYKHGGTISIDRHTDSASGSCSPLTRVDEAQSCPPSLGPPYLSSA